MNCRQLIHRLELLCPKEHAEHWDNPGLICGDFEKDIKKVYIALDATSDVIEDAVSRNADFILTHHPLIFSGLKKIHTDDFTGRRIIKMIQSGICCYAMHTNFDVDIMGTLAADMLGLSDQGVLQVTRKDFVVSELVEYGIGRTGVLPHSMSLAECAQLVKRTFDIPNVRIFGNPDASVRTVAICPGSGKDLIDDVKRTRADVYISGDFGHHNGIDANEDGILVIDAGHQGIEHIFIDYMKTYIEEHCEDIDVCTEKSCAPFITI